ncbi:hypothetical protein P153DRAFT_29720 [Dothidotthia symphoricarpi CBS 119687]|uniref:Prokaryotic-type class I peptide chain release factors domain-containing protein n=1 Tax=Dothidotthia symphoricarpi CBS 119687 TaxID=1392245 RepID=A0A6A6ACN4_9PLEO|nr:uncharacterized protein P153DRAFT_29720 [Dothidotthia symphoricarpi CBS 119687]KAF2129003.1 hypothetical protein P153DRAFT_29720 [Dothidotthia symphoricarpi CBS 119687]
MRNTPRQVVTNWLYDNANSMPPPTLTFTTMMSLRPLLALSRPQAHLPLIRAFTTTIARNKAAHSKALPPRTPILDSEIVENFLKGSGPGGQKINKTSSAVQLIHLPTGIVVKYQDTRSRELNRKMARRILQDRIEEGAELEGEDQGDSEEAETEQVGRVEQALPEGAGKAGGG